MAKEYSDRQMSSKAEGRDFFFPKASPPRTIRARNREDAAKKLEKTLPEKKVLTDSK